MSSKLTVIDLLSERYFGNKHVLLHGTFFCCISLDTKTAILA